MRNNLPSILEIIRDEVKAEKIILLPNRSLQLAAPVPQQLPCYHLLVLTNGRTKENVGQVEKRIEKECKRFDLTHVILHDISWFNERLREQHYFYPELKSAEILYNHNRIKLSEQKPGPISTIQYALRRCFHFLYHKSQQYLERALDVWHQGIRDLEALSQSAWYIYTAVEIVFTGADPQSCNLLRLRSSTARFSGDLAIVFPNHSAKEQKLLERLHKHAIKKPMREVNQVPAFLYEGYLNRMMDLQMIALLVCHEHINRLFCAGPIPDTT